MSTGGIFTLLSKLRILLHRNLPGADAHILMAPPARIQLFKSGSKPPENSRKAAVLIPLYFKDGELHTVFIKRPVYDGVHSGQIAFPGGKKEDFDKDYIDTAIREANEEIGIQPKDVYVLGALSELYIPPSNFLIRPVVAYIAKRPDFVLQEDEVEEIIEVPVSHFYPVIKKEFIEINPGYSAPFMAPCYKVKSIIIWGATAMVISEFINIAKEINLDEILNGR
ncbi:CoA pyrophosphatase [Bacteroidales bacterium OttesenSCG-928-C19]|nr:CoA pyrophosphatase [Bacteroidales bacterium OttesenSCG-928-C19]